VLHHSTAGYTLKNENTNDSDARHSPDKHRSRRYSNRPPLQDANHSNVDDSQARIRELEAQLRDAQSAVEHANADRNEALQQAYSAATQSESRHARATAVPPESIDPPAGGVSKAKMQDIKTALRFNTSRWNALRTAVRYTMAAARLNWDRNWKTQRPDKTLCPGE